MKDQLQELATTARKYTEGECSFGALENAIDAAEDALKPHQQSDADYVCPACGSDQIQDQMWVMANTEEVLNSCESYMWCNTCDAEGRDGEFRYPIPRREFQAEHGIIP